MERRSVDRRDVDFYGIQLADGGRYLHRIINFSRTGLLLRDPLPRQRPGQVMELLLPRPLRPPVHVRAEVVRVDGDRVGLRAIGQHLYDLGGQIDL